MAVKNSDFKLLLFFLLCGCIWLRMVVTDSSSWISSINLFGILVAFCELQNNIQRRYKDAKGIKFFDGIYNIAKCFFMLILIYIFLKRIDLGAKCNDILTLGSLILAVTDDIILAFLGKFILAP